WHRDRTGDSLRLEHDRKEDRAGGKNRRRSTRSSLAAVSVADAEIGQSQGRRFGRCAQGRRRSLEEREGFTLYQTDPQTLEGLDEVMADARRPSMRAAKSKSAAGNES